MTTSRKKSSGPSTGTDALLAEIFRSPEYLAALKDRLIRSEAKAQEIAVARSLGLLIPRQDEDTEAREAMRRMDTAARRIMIDLIRLSTSKDSTAIRVIRTGDMIGIGYSPQAITPSRPRYTVEPEPVSDSDDLMPR